MVTVVFLGMINVQSNSLNLKPLMAMPWILICFSSSIELMWMYQLQFLGKTLRSLDIFRLDLLPVLSC
jgi:hypothetical protein